MEDAPQTARLAYHRGAYDVAISTLNSLASASGDARVQHNSLLAHYMADG